MKGIKKVAAAFILCFALIACVPAGITASANSAMLHWRGSNSAGAVVMDKNCPVRVESELLTFDINEFPQNHYAEEEKDKFLSYGGKVTAKYNFYNPADYDVKMTLAFPFGAQPDYAYFYENVDDTAKYSVTADGENVETKLRHTLWSGDFNTEADVGRLVDGFKKDEFYSENLPVYIYRFHISGITYNGERWVHAELPLNSVAGRKIVFSSNGYYYDGSLTISWYVENGDDLTIYSVGKPMTDDEFNFKFYNYGKFNKKYYVDGKAERNPEKDKDEVITFRQLALSHRSEDSVVSESDWYNAAVDYLNVGEIEGGYISDSVLFLEPRLMRWYQYSLEIPAGGRLINEVTAPLYPSIDGYYSPNIYEYEYLLSPAQGWAAFGSLEVRINTPFCLLENSIGDFEKTDYGYLYKSETLPDRELTFELCESEHPVRTGNGCNGYMIAFIIIPLCLLFGILTVVAGVVILIVFLVKKPNPNRK